MRHDLPRGFKIYLSVLGALAVLCIVTAVVWFAVSARRAPDQPQYLLKDNAGRVALYAADGTGPLAQYDIYTRLLPESDALALERGIAVQDEAELQRMLEDYGL